MRHSTLLNKKDGMTLIEILVAMAIFTVGVLIIVRIFPTGFSILRHTTSATIASRLAQAELERIQASNTMPAGILAGARQTNGAFQFIDTDFSKISDSNALGSDVNKFSFVFEEPASIPAPTSDAGGMYPLLFGPVTWRSNLTEGDPVDNLNRSIIVYSAPMLKLELPENTLDYTTVETNSSDYLIDYANNKIYVHPSADDRNFVLSYTDTNMRSYVGVVYHLPGTSSTANQEIVLSLDSDPTVTIRKGSEVLHQRFDQIADTTGDATADMAKWNPNNPYQYRVRHASNLANGLAYGIEFSPYAYDKTETTSTGTRPLKAYVSYEVLDWHIIHEDRRIADAPTSFDDPVLNVRLSLGSIKKTGFTRETDGGIYGGIWTTPDAQRQIPQLEYDVVALDLTDGQLYNLKYDHEIPVGSLNVVDPLDGQEKQAFTNIEYKDGLVRFNPYFRGHTVRIYYRAMGDWAVAPYRTYGGFVPFYRDNSTSPIVLNYGQYYGEYLNGRKKLYFPASYAGQSVVLDYVYAVPQLVGSPKYHTVTGDIHYIDPQQACAIDFTTMEDTLNRNHSSEMPAGEKVEIMPDDGRLLDDKLTQDYSYAPRVRGASMGVRVIHKDIGEGFKGGIWKLTDLQSSPSLTR